MDVWSSADFFVYVFVFSCFIQLWETKKVHTSSAVCLKRDSDVVFSDAEIIVSAADNCNRLQVSCKEREKNS